MYEWDVLSCNLSRMPSFPFVNMCWPTAELKKKDLIKIFNWAVEFESNMLDLYGAI